MKTKHTPGPWSILDLLNGNPNLIEIYEEEVRDGDRWSRPICKVQHFHRHSDDTVRANAHLIAAAPDMLEALQDLGNDNKSIPEAIWNKVKAAIAKATGEAITTKTPPPCL